MYICNMEEIWKDIEGYEGLYQVSNYGNIKAFYYKGKKHQTLLRKSVGKLGYEMVGLNKNGVHKTFTVHRLVAQAFIPNPDNKPCIDHINTDKTDNRVENLRWCTQKENLNNPLTKEIWGETHKGRVVLSTRGGKHHNAKKIHQFTKDGIFIKEWSTPIEAARELGYRCSTTIRDCCRGKQKTAGGFIWKYVA